MPTYTPSFLAMGWASFHLTIYAFRFIFKGLKMLNETTSGRDYESSSVVGKEN
jgi:hypothetical protein